MKRRGIQSKTQTTKPKRTCTKQIVVMTGTTTGTTQFDHKLWDLTTVSGGYGPSTIIGTRVIGSVSGLNTESSSFPYGNHGWTVSALMVSNTALTPALTLTNLANLSALPGKVLAWGVGSAGFATATNDISALALKHYDCTFSNTVDLAPMGLLMFSFKAAAGDQSFIFGIQFWAVI
jgi:hypothetical protein